MAEFINTIDALGDEVVFNTVIDRSITEFKDNQIASVGEAAFNGCTSLTEIELPEVTSVGPWAFGYCNFAELNMPKLKGVGNNAFRYNSSIKTVDGPNITSVGTDGFSNCTSLESVNLPIMTGAPSAGFAGCTALKTVNMPLIKSLANNTFNGCTSLESINLPAATGAGGHSTFQKCLKLKSVELPKLASITGSSLFNTCLSLPMVDFPSLTNMGGGGAFNSCFSINRILLRSTSGVVSLSSVGHFNNTPYTIGTGGKIFVPRALISAYQTATNWSTLYASGKCEFLAVEDVTVDGSVTGELKKCASISLDKTTLSFTSAGSKTLTATFVPALPYVDEIVWSSSDRSVAIVDDGVVTAVGNGSTTITVTCGDKTAICNVTVSGVTSPVHWWSLAEATTLDGVDDYIDTGIALFKDPIDFTIVVDCSFLSTHSTGRIFDCSAFGGDLNRQYFGMVRMICQNSNPIVKVAYKTGTWESGSFTSVNLDNWSKVSAVAIRYVAGVIDSVLYKNTSGDIINVVITGDPHYEACPTTLIIGAGWSQNSAMTDFYNTTVNTFDIYSSALDDSAIFSILQSM